MLVRIELFLFSDTAAKAVIINLLLNDFYEWKLLTHNQGYNTSFIKLKISSVGFLLQLQEQRKSSKCFLLNNFFNLFLKLFLISIIKFFLSEIYILLSLFSKVVPVCYLGDHVLTSWRSGSSLIRAELDCSRHRIKFPFPQIFNFPFQEQPSFFPFSPSFSRSRAQIVVYRGTSQ